MFSLEEKQRHYQEAHEAIESGRRHNAAEFDTSLENVKFWWELTTAQIAAAFAMFTTRGEACSEYVYCIGTDGDVVSRRYRDRSKER